MLLSTIVASSMLFILVPRARSQGTNATCHPTYNWMNNSLGQSICLVTAYLLGACDTDPTYGYIPALGADDWYYAQFADPTKCTCSAVFYTTYTACAVCQGGKADWFSNFVSTCSSSEITPVGLPDTIPHGTAVPAWAFMDLTSLGYFDPAAAQVFAEANDTSITGSGTLSSSTASSESSTTSFTSTSSASASLSSPPVAQASTGSSTNVGAIAGGVGGGIGGLIVVLGAIFGVAKHEGVNVAAIMCNFHPREKSKKKRPDPEKGDNESSTSERD